MTKVEQKRTLIKHTTGDTVSKKKKTELKKQRVVNISDTYVINAIKHSQEKII